MHTLKGHIGLLVHSGLAVSGGADSMALAYLCRQLELTPIGGPVSVTAFVVDHRARPESGDEAKSVSTWLSDIGMCPLFENYAVK